MKRDTLSDLRLVLDLTVSFQSQMAPQRVLAGIPQIQLGPIVGLIGSSQGI